MSNCHQFAKFGKLWQQVAASVRYAGPKLGRMQMFGQLPPPLANDYSFVDEHGRQSGQLVSSRGRRGRRRWRRRQ